MREAPGPFTHEPAKRVLLLEANQSDVALVRTLLCEAPSVEFEIEHTNGRVRSAQASETLCHA